jgi:peptidoglycan/LPS O-acetylase OafA/YrhL
MLLKAIEDTQFPPFEVHCEKVNNVKPVTLNVIVQHLKPLLHTWSLAVEEQFYLLYPLMLLGLARLRRPLGSLIFLLLCVGSFAVSVDGVAHHPQATFYLLPSRAWELGLGAVVAAPP